MTRPLRRRLLWIGALGGALVLTGCTRGGEFQAISMWNESRLKPLESSPDPSRASSAREFPVGTVARGQLRVDTVLYEGRTEDGNLATRVPFAITQPVLLRGQEQFNIYCAPCHSRNGDGNGLIVERGFPRPPDYAIPRLRNAPIGHFYDVITNGYGVMYSYASRVHPNDRWAIAAYIRVLQRARPVAPDTRPEITVPTRRVLPQPDRPAPEIPGVQSTPDVRSTPPGTSPGGPPGLTNGTGGGAPGSVMEGPPPGGPGSPGGPGAAPNGTSPTVP